MANGLSASLRDAAHAPSEFSRVYDAKAQELLAFLMRRTFDVEVARDLTAETFAQAFEHRRRFRGQTDAEASAWLYSIARHQLGRYARNGVIQRKAVERLGIELPAVSDDDHQRIIELAGLADLRKSVADAVSTLPPDQREALRLRVIDEHPYSDVAATLGVSEETARARVSRALRRIADLIDMPTPTGVNP
ncbi:MAG: sigma-70 family RNA polymerase sigma factor [Chloroflexi bacterium]|nr:sigma-70 family RNA polymerase sigma factor [Chloroflexota bacterium]